MTYVWIELSYLVNLLASKGKEYIIIDTDKLEYQYQNQIVEQIDDVPAPVKKEVVHVPKIIMQERVQQRAVDQIVDTPVPMTQKEVVQVSMTTAIPPLRAQQQKVELIVDVPIPKMQEEIVHVPKIISQKRVQPRAAEHSSDADARSDGARPEDHPIGTRPAAHRCTGRGHTSSHDAGWNGAEAPSDREDDRSAQHQESGEHHSSAGGYPESCAHSGAAPESDSRSRKIQNHPEKCAEEEADHSIKTFEQTVPVPTVVQKHIEAPQSSYNDEVAKVHVTKHRESGVHHSSVAGYPECSAHSGAAPDSDSRSRKPQNYPEIRAEEEVDHSRQTVKQTSSAANSDSNSDDDLMNQLMLEHNDTSSKFDKEEDALVLKIYAKFLARCDTEA